MQAVQAGQMDRRLGNRIVPLMSPQSAAAQVGARRDNAAAALYGGDCGFDSSIRRLGFLRF